MSQSQERVHERQQRLRAARLYLICDEQPSDFLAACLQGGVDLVQLRMKHSADEAVIATARRFGQVCATHGALLILNDRPDLVDAAGADGAHVGQDDMPPARARSQIGPERILGLSTHSREQIDDAVAMAIVDYIGVGPVYPTPTKPGRTAVGLDLVRYAAQEARLPFFAVGGVSPGNVDAVRAAGASRVAVVRALTEAADPVRVARELREAVTPVTEMRRDPLGSTQP